MSHALYNNLMIWGCLGAWFLSILFWTPLAALHIAIVLDNPHQESLDVKDFAIEEITALLKNEATFSTDHQFIANGSKRDIEQTLQQALDDPEVDLIIALGPLSSSQALHWPNHFSKPVIAPFVFEEFEEHEATHHSHNFLAFIIPDLWTLASQTLRDALHVQRVGVVLPHERIEDTRALTQKLSQKYGTPVHIIPWNHGQTSWPNDLDMIYLPWLATASQEEISQIISHTLQAKTPLFSLSSDPFLALGVTGSFAGPDFLHRILRRTALRIQDISLTDQDRSTQEMLDVPLRLGLHQGSVETLNLSLPWDLLLNATIYNPQESKPGLSLKQCVLEAVERNTALQVAWKNVTQSKYDVSIAKASLYPQLQTQLQGRIINKRLAQSSIGTEPQTLVTGLLNVRQMLYSNELLGAYSIAKDVHQSQIDTFHETYLDLVASVALAFLQVLEAQTITSIQQSNLEFSRKNLETAQQRASIGMAKFSEVYRWESQIAQNKTALVQANAQQAQASLALSRLLNICDLEPIALQNILDTTNPILSDWNFSQKLTTQKGVQEIAQISVQLGQNISPTIHKHIAQIFAQAHRLGISQRALYLPDVFFSTDIRHRLYRGGTGENSPLLKNWNWGMFLHVEFPLYDAGAKVAKLQQARESLRQAQLSLQIQYEAIEESIRTELVLLTSAFTSITLTKDRWDAAEKNLSLIQNTYELGQTEIINLLDAQTQSLHAQLEHAKALYALEKNLIRYQKALGLFVFLLSPQQQRVYQQLFMPEEEERT